MLRKYFVGGDVHDDVEAMKKFVDYAAAQRADGIFFDGDFSLRPYKKEDLADLLAQRTAEGIPKDAIRKFIVAKRKTNGQLLSQMKDVLDSSEVPYIVVPGNYDPPSENIWGEKDLHMKVRRSGETRFFGYGGADAWPQHIGLLNQMGEISPYDQQQLYDGLCQSNPDVVLLHNPPLGLCDNLFDGKNVGSKAAAQYIFERTPKLVIAGHIHEAGPLGNNPAKVKGMKGIRKGEKKTLVINPGNLGRFELVKMPSLETQMRFPFGTFMHVELEDDGTPKLVVHYSMTGPEGKDKISEVREIDRYSIE